MRVNRGKGGIGLAVGVAVLLVGIVVSVVPPLDYSSDEGLYISFRAHLNKVLDLAGVGRLPASRLVTGFVPALLSGRYPADVEPLRIDIKFKHLRKIKKDRKKAIEDDILRRAQMVPAEIEHDGRRYDAQVRLKGRLADHWFGSQRWSFRVRLKGGETIHGMSQFNLQRPSVRQPPHEQMFQFWQRQNGNLSPRYEFFKVTLNGDYWGIMAAEEHMTHHFLELNERKEAPIMSLGSIDRWYYQTVNADVPDLPRAHYGEAEIGIYGEKRYRDDDRMRALFSRAAHVYRGLVRGDIPAESALDMEAFAESLAISLAWNHLHPLQDDNARYYFNPYTLRLEPITTDQSIYNVIDTSNPEKNPPFSGAEPGFPVAYRRLIQIRGFAAGFAEAVETATRTLPSLQEEHDRVCANFPFDCVPHFEYILRENLGWLAGEGGRFVRRFNRRVERGQEGAGMGDAARRALANNPLPPRADVDYPEHIHAEYYDDGTLRVYNLLPHEVVVDRIEVQCSAKADDGDGGCRERSLLAEPFVVRSGLVDGLPASTDVQLPVLHLNGDQRLRIRTLMAGQRKNFELSFTFMTDVFDPIHDQPDVLALDPTPPFLVIGDGTVRVSQGNWTIEAPLLLPEGHSLSIPAGTTLSFAPDAYLLVRGPLLVEGSAEAPVRFAPVEATWKGIYVLEADGRSILRHTTFADTTFFEHGVLQLTGGVSFYRSDVTLEHVRFEGSVAEDALNIIHSDFEIVSSVFRDTRSDAFDSDFSTGHLEDVRFEAIAGDGLDTSGSRVSGDRLTFVDIADKGISAGEASEVALKNVRAERVGAGAVSKDGSRLTIEGLAVEEHSVSAGMAYQKKGFYGPSSLEISGTALPPDAFHVDLDDRLVIDGEVVPGTDLDVEALYREGPMKKIQRGEDRRL